MFVIVSYPVYRKAWICPIPKKLQLRSSLNLIKLIEAINITQLDLPRKKSRPTINTQIACANLLSLVSNPKYVSEFFSVKPQYG